MIGAALATIVSAVFAVFMFWRWLARRRPYEAAWAIGLAMFAVASAAGLARQASGASELDYRIFYLFGAILNVAWLALGTIYLLAPRSAARWTTLALIAFTHVAVIAVLASPVDLTRAIDTGRGFESSPLPRILAGLGSGVGSIVLIGGALWSAWVFVRRGHQGRRALANVIIAAGVLVAAAGGTAAFTGATGIVEWTNFVGVSLIFIGSLIL